MLSVTAFHAVHKLFLMWKNLQLKISVVLTLCVCVCTLWESLLSEYVLVWLMNDECVDYCSDMPTKTYLGWSKDGYLLMEKTPMTHSWGGMTCCPQLTAVIPLQLKSSSTNGNPTVSLKLMSWRSMKRTATRKKSNLMLTTMLSCEVILLYGYLKKKKSIQVGGMSSSSW